jgi:hypothetical protein
MAYLGNAPARSFISFERQVFTIVNSQTAYTLSHSVTNENDIRLVINNIIQEPGSGKAYTASGTTLTLSAALTNGTDEMYCVFLGRATATNAPAAGSVNTAAIAADAITEAKIADGAVESEHLNANVISGQTELAEAPADTDELLVSDAGVLKRMDYSYIKASSDFVKLASGEVTSSTSQVDIEGYFSSTYENYRLVLNAVHPATASAINLRLKLSGSYATTYYYWLYSGLNSVDDHSTSENYNAYYSNDRFYVSAHMDTNQDRSGHSIIDIFQPYKTDRHKYIQFRSIGTTAAANNQMTFVAGGGFQMTDLGACTGVRVFMSSGNIETMDYQLYGIKK